MIIVESIEQLSHNPFKSPFALIPTMGNLHSGHINLLNLASNKNYNPVVSIFVNPLQFGPSEDLETYPRSLEQDLEILKEHNCHGVFVPKQEEILKNIENLIAPMSNKLCSKSRPGHFDGVITIVNRLFEVTKPEACVFGMKDFQQQLIIKHLIRQKKYEIEFLSAPTERDKNGLALSSRNNYLQEREKIEASVIFKSLSDMGSELKLLSQTNKKNFLTELESIQKKYTKKIEEQGFEIDYLELSDPETLEKFEFNSNRILIAIAVFFKKVRLIDNLVIDLASS
ncbi:MAG: pantoate--beta-alanine ligase [Proteobacteria bacterium]|nr:pantoate--beta-alanine ligase [Pseudomonadota bacterium]RZO98948.1 MAG: pantoate--beta-alanine ligase [Gammaproteobacteria bacterium]